MHPLTFVMLLACCILFIYVTVLTARLVKSDISIRKGSGSVTRSDGLPVCKYGECVTNIKSGVKRCPADSEPEPFDPASETCNKRFSCSSPLTPHPIGLNGETLVGRKCPKGVPCNCSSVYTCPTDRATVLLGSTAAFHRSRVIAVKNGQQKIHPGYSLVCNIPREVTEEVFKCGMESKKDIFACIAGNKGGEVCPYGTAAVKMREYAGNQEDDTFYCIHASPCPSDRVLYYDPTSRKSFCLAIDESASSV